MKAGATAMLIAVGAAVIAVSFFVGKASGRRVQSLYDGKMAKVEAGLKDHLDKPNAHINIEVIYE